ncbi:hypothetical protein ILYODFUR_028803 [Ilyodon furcidens]|uniref:Uncharacterized protein n=1 Tax=Ilyodon furcidens TaxID=33524 RepID=A0ABV0TP68_9TELE
MHHQRLHTSAQRTGTSLNRGAIYWGMLANSFSPYYPFTLNVYCCPRLKGNMYFVYSVWCIGLHGGTVGTLLPCRKKVLDSTPCRRSVCMEFACSPRACVGPLRVLQLPPPGVALRWTVYCCYPGEKPCEYKCKT